MGTSTNAFLKTTFEEFEKNMSHWITRKELSRRGSKYTRIYGFLFRGQARHSITYNNKVDIDEWNYTNRNDISDKERDDRFNERETWSYTVMDSQIHHDDGVPNGYQGIFVSLGHDQNAVDFLTIMCYMFGGYLQETDTGHDFVWIDKNFHKVIDAIFQD